MAPSSNFHLQLVASASQYVAGRRNRPERHGNCSDIEHSIREVRFVFVLFRNCCGRPHGAIFFERPIDSRRSRCEPDLGIHNVCRFYRTLWPRRQFRAARNVTGSALTFGGVFDPDFIVPLDGFQIVEVPEPSTMVLAGLALTGLASRRPAAVDIRGPSLTSRWPGRPAPANTRGPGRAVLSRRRARPDCRASRPRRLDQPLPIRAGLIVQLRHGVAFARIIELLDHGAVRSLTQSRKNCADDLLTRGWSPIST